MHWFAWERSPSGIPTPAGYDERPDKEFDMCKNVIWHTVCPIPDELQDAPLVVLAEWAKTHAKPA